MGTGSKRLHLVRRSGKRLSQFLHLLRRQGQAGSAERRVRLRVRFPGTQENQEALRAIRKRSNLPTDEVRGLIFIHFISAS
jgi:hypothetical protein